MQEIFVDLEKTCVTLYSQTLMQSSEKFHAIGRFHWTIPSGFVRLLAHR